MPKLTLQTEVQYLKGVGPRRAETLARVGIVTVGDLLQYLPRRYIDRSMITPIGSLTSGTSATIIGKVMGKGMLYGRTKRLEVMLGDDSGYVPLIWFAGYKYLEKMFNKGDIYAVTGPVTYFQQLQMVHPEIERIEDDDDRLIHTGRIVPVYPSTADLKAGYVTGRVMRQIISRALDMIGDDIPEFLPDEIRREYGLPDMAAAINNIHYPENNDQAETARKRLALNELLELQYLILSSRDEHQKIVKGFRCAAPGQSVAKFVKALPFELTSDQKKVGAEIYDDMQSERPMHRLMQGDVGCGKTVVALLAGVFAAENGLQTAFMAPTELLAEQHYRTWREALEEIGIKSALLTGSMKKNIRTTVEKVAASGEVDILFGTHALLSDPVKFKRLGLVIIDEQHRFGVMQRGQLITKGMHPDTLVMTATPIPRTLALTLYGDLDISSIKTLPPGRQTTKTVWRTADKRDEIYDYLRGELTEGRQTFIIYPLVERSEKMDLQAAEDEYKRLKQEIFKEFKVGLVHGRVKKEDREKTIKEYRDGKLSILVATTVIEVGIDIPSASIMIIEHAERFGLSQLHQLRGRVGRGERRGLTIAVASAPVTELAKKRLELFVSTTDGFKIAEADLELRGPGEFFGTRQHGLPELKVADLSRDTDLLPISRRVVAMLLKADKSLDNAGQNLLSYLQRTAAGRRSLTRFG